MSRVCPSCDQAPDAASEAAGSCSACGTSLVLVDDRDPLIGMILDNRFELRERLGAGAMGVVYRATQLSIGRDVAVKVMTGLDVIAVKRFFREAQIASALSHPNTVQVIEFGQGADGRVYIAMELVRGRTLLDEIHDGPLSSRRICRIGSQLCEALEAAHRLTIVHRDLKPENVMLSAGDTDHVKILDFGIARVLGDAKSQLTGVGLVAGTPSYMAPEVLGNAADPASSQDMYALGVILAELALGRSLWAPSSLEMLLVAKTLSQNVDDVPARFRPLVRRLIDPDPEKRPRASDVRNTLRELDRASDDPVGIAATFAPMPALVLPRKPAGSPAPDLTFPEVLELADINGAPADPRVEASPVPVPRTPAPVRPPPVATLELELEVDRSARKVTTRARSPARESEAPRSSARGLRGPVIVIALLAAVGGGLYYVASRPQPAIATGNDLPAQPASPPTTAPVIAPVPDRPAAQQPPAASSAAARPHGVSIRIIGAARTPITIDGHAAGTTPLSLVRSAGKRPITIEAPDFVVRIIPDHDQTIDVSQR